MSHEKQCHIEQLHVDQRDVKLHQPRASTVVVHARPALFLETLSLALSGAGHAVRGSTGNALAAAALGSQLRPDLCILDAAEGSDCLDAARRMRSLSPAVKLLVLCVGPSSWVHRAYDDYVIDTVVDRTCDFEQLKAALLSSLRGDRCLMNGFLDRAHDPVSPTELTLRERQVLERLVRGATTYAIADELRISPHTVRTHVHSLMRKLEVHRRSRAVSVALARNLLSARSAS